MIMEVKNGLLLPELDPAVAGDLAVVFVGLSVAFSPRVVFTAGQVQPGQQSFRWRVGAIGPVLQVIDYRVSRVRGNPASF